MLRRSQAKGPKLAERSRTKSDVDRNAVNQVVKRAVAYATSDDARVVNKFPPVPGAQPTMLETEVDGVRWLMIRADAADARAAAKPSLVPPRPEPALSARRPRPNLSPREREIVRMVAQGYPNKIIADVLEISTWTVGTYLRRLFAKLGVTARAAMVARILEEGLLSAPVNEPPPAGPTAKP